MPEDALDKLRAENPIPELLPGPSLDAIRSQLDDAEAHRRTPMRAPRRTSRLVPVVLSIAVVVAVVAIALTTAGNHTPSRNPAGPHPTPPTQTTSSRPTDTSSPLAAQAFLDGMLPRDGADFASGQRLLKYTIRVRLQAETACLAADGLPGPPDPHLPSSRFGTVQQPDMAAIRSAHNIGITTTTGPTYPGRSLKPTQRKAYRARLSYCQTQTRGIAAFERNASAVALAESWYSAQAAAIHSPQVQAAMKTGATCASQTAFPAATASQEIERVEGKLTPLNLKGETAKANAINAGGARVLVKCFSHPEAVQTKLLAAKRRQVIQSHSAEIKRIEQQVDRQVKADQTRYGLKFQ
jgi:hypothetical protein